MKYTNKSKIVLAKRPDLLAGEQIESLAVLSAGGNVVFIGSNRKIYKKEEVEILSKGVPVRFLYYVLNLMRIK